MKPIMIIENNSTPLSLFEELVIKEKKVVVIGGIFTEFDVKNRNERVYTSGKFLPCLEELNDRISKMGVYGEFDHPDVFDTSLARASHLVKEAVYNKEFNRVEGKIQLLSTHWGKEARALHEDNCPIFVSSRAAGVTENDGTVTLKKLFTYDIVADPGFSSAKMGCINESLGYKSNENTNFRIYEMSDESKINDLFNMNKNDFVTKEQMTDYSNYLVKELGKTNKSLTEALKKGNMDPKKLENLLEYYEALNNTNAQMVKYLDYLAETVQVVVNDNKNLREVSEKLIAHNDYLAENLEKAINYTEYIAESVDKTIEYTEYIAESLDKTIAYGEYIAEQLDKNIAYSEYIAENLDATIAYGEYIAESVDNTIAYSEYLAEHVEGNIAYSEYIAEHLDENIAYSEYIAENLDKNIAYSGLISEKLNGGKVNEDVASAIPTLEEWGFTTEDEVVAEEETIVDEITPVAETEETTEETTEIPVETEIASIEDIAAEVDNTLDAITDILDAEAPVEVPEFVDTVEVPTETPEFVAPELETPEFVAPTLEAPAFGGESETELTASINLLIAEATKRKIVETSDLHFLKFLNKSQVDSYYSLTNEEQELVKIHISERSYFNANDVLRLIQESLAVKNESLENRVVRLMPDSVKAAWENMNESAKKSILSQARLGYDLTNEGSIEHFWYTRNLNKVETKKLISHDSLIQEDTLSQNEIDLIMERIKGLK
jgi:hypothetical protein